MVEAELVKTTPETGVYMMTYTPSKRVAMRDVFLAVCQHHDIPWADFTGKGRTRHLAWPRQQAYWLVDRFRPDLSFLRIARAAGRSDHACVVHGINQVNKRLKAGMDDARDLVAIATLLGLEFNPEATERRWRLPEIELERRADLGLIRKAA